MTAARLVTSPCVAATAADDVALDQGRSMPSLEAAGPVAPPLPVFAEGLALLLRGGVHRRHVLYDGDAYLRH